MAYLNRKPSISHLGYEKENLNEPDQTYEIYKKDKASTDEAGLVVWPSSAAGTGNKARIV